MNNLNLKTRDMETHETKEELIKATEMEIQYHYLKIERHMVRLEEAKAKLKLLKAV